MLAITSDEDHGMIEAVVDGAVSRADYEAVVAAVDAMLATRTRISFVEVVRDIGPIAPEVWWRDIVFHLHHRDFLDRAAIVTDKGWVGPMVRLLAPLYPAAIRTFPESRIEEARAWARNG